jgi:hypothetical protein
MKMRVKYNDLYKLGDYISKKDEDIKEIFNEIEQINDDIPNYWSGVDSDLFNINFTDFINTSKNNEIKIENLGILLKTVSNGYKSRDEDWDRQMKKANEEARIYEEPEEEIVNDAY